MERSSGTKKKVVSNLIWKIAERTGAQGVTFVVSIILARILDPTLYGTVALVTVLTSILQVFIDSGLGNALIQKKDADEKDYSCVFYFNMLMCCILYIGMFVASPYIAKYYDDNSLELIIKVMSLTLIISGLKNVQHAYIASNLLFKKNFYATLGGTFGSAIVGIIIALLGGGVWALVAQNLVSQFINTIVLWFTTRWRPVLFFSWRRLKALLQYGWKLLVAALLESIYNNLTSLIIGKVYTKADLAFYNKGRNFPNILVSNINSSIDSIMLPVLSKVQDNTEKVKQWTRKAVRVSSFIMWPMMIGLAVCAKPLILLLLTDKWIGCVPYMQLYCISYAFWPIHTANLNAIKAMGRSDVFLRLEIIKKIFGVIIILIALPYGPLALVAVMAIMGPIYAIINAGPNTIILKYSFKEQLLDVLPSICCALLMGTVIWPIQYLEMPCFMILCLQILFGILLYIGIAFLLHISECSMLFRLIKDVIKGKERSASDK